MNEINKLIWPSPNGVGMIDKADWDQTVDVALNTKNPEGKTVLTKEPDAEAYSNDYVNKALDELKADRRRRDRRQLQADHGDAERGRLLKLLRQPPLRFGWLLVAALHNRWCYEPAAALRRPARLCL